MATKKRKELDQKAVGDWRKRFGVSDDRMSLLEIWETRNDPDYRAEVSYGYDQKRRENAKKQQEKYEAQKKKVLDMGLDLGMSWEDMASQTGLELSEIEEYSKKNRPDYGIGPSNAQKVKNKLIPNSVKSDEPLPSESLTLGSFKEGLEGRPELTGKANKPLEELSKYGTSAVAGIGRFGAGLMQTAGTLYDYATPGEGSNRLTDLGKRSAEDLDYIVEEYGDQGMYTATQIASEAALVFANPTKAVGTVLSKVPTSTRVGKALTTARGAGVGNEVLFTTRQVANELSNEEKALTARMVVENAALSAVFAFGPSAGRNVVRFFTEPSENLKSSVRNNIIQTLNHASEVDTTAKKVVSEMPNPTSRTSKKTTQALGEFADKQKQAATNTLVDEGRKAPKKARTKDPLTVETNTTGKPTPPTKSTTSRAKTPSKKGEKFTPKTSKSVAKKGSKAVSRAGADGDSWLASLDLPEAERVNLTDQSSIVDQMFDKDVASTIEMAMTGQGIPEGVSHSVIFARAEDYIQKAKGLSVEQREGLLEGLAKSPLNLEFTGSAQTLSGLQIRDKSAPLSVFKTVERDMKKFGVPGGVTKTEKSQLYEKYAKWAEVDDIAKQTGKAEDRLRAAIERTQYESMVRNLKNSKKLSVVEALKQGEVGYVTKEAVAKLFGITKQLRSTADASALGRQGWPVLFKRPDVWAKNAWNTHVKDIRKMMKRGASVEDIMDATKANIMARPNYELYKRGGVRGIGEDMWEEAFPLEWTKKVFNSKAAKAGSAPFRVTEAAFTNFQLSNRVDMFDLMYNSAVKSGIPITDDFLKQLGNRANTLTRTLGGKKMDKTTGKVLNATLFSPGMITSNLKLMGGHLITGGKGANMAFDKGSNFIRKEAAKDLVTMGMGAAATLWGMSAITGGRAEADPRSSDFGKIRFGDTRIDLTGGLTGMMTLFSRVLTTSTKSAITGEITKLNDPDTYNGKTVFDVFSQWGQNKASPLGSVILDYANGKTYEGTPPTIGSTARALTIPLVWESFLDAKDQPHAANILAISLAEFLGFSTNTYGIAGNGWAGSNRKDVGNLKDNLSKEKFEAADKKYQEIFTDWYNTISSDDKFWQLEPEDRANEITKARGAIIERITEEYGVKKYQTRKRTAQEKEDIKYFGKYLK